MAHLSCCLAQPSDGLGEPADDKIAQHEQHRQTDDACQQQDALQLGRLPHHLAVGAHDRCRPSCAQRRIHHICGFAARCEIDHAVAAAQHLAIDAAAVRIFRHAGLYQGGQTAVLHPDQRSVATQYRAERPLVGTHLLDNVFYPFRFHVHLQRQPFAHCMAVGHHPSVAAVGVGRTPCIAVALGLCDAATAHAVGFLGHVPQDSLHHAFVVAHRPQQLCGVARGHLHLVQRCLDILDHRVQLQVGALDGLSGDQAAGGDPNRHQHRHNQQCHKQQRVEAQPQRDGTDFAHSAKYL